MAASTESSTSAEEHDVQKQKSVDPAPASDLTAEQNGGMPIGLLSAVGQPSDSANKFITHRSLSHPANSQLRNIAFKRAQQTHGNRFAQRALADIQRRPLPSASPLQNSNATAATEAPAATTDVAVPANSAGEPLDPSTRGVMEPRFQRDFSDVRVHTDTRAAESARALSADAYTVNRDIYFASGKYAPETGEGRHLLAHELTHTIQQNEGRIQRAGAAAGSIVPAPAEDQSEREAEQKASQVAEGKPAPDRQPALPPPSRQSTAPPKEPGVKVPAPAITDKSSKAQKAPQAESAKKPKGGPEVEGPPAPKRGASPVAAAKAKAHKAAPTPPVVAPAFSVVDLVPVAEPLSDLITPGPIGQGPLPTAETEDYRPETAIAQVEDILSQFESQAETRKQQIRQTNAISKARVAETGIEQQAQIRGQIADSLSSIRKKVSNEKAEIATDAATVKTFAAITTTTSYLSLLLKTTAQIKTINDSATAHKKKATEAVATEREAVRKFGADEGKRGKTAIDKQAQDAVTKGNTKAAGYPGDERGRVQAEAVLKVAADTSAKLAEPGPKLESTMIDGGIELAKGITDVDKEVAKAIDEETPKITGELFKQATALSPQFETIRKDVAKGVDDFVTETNGKFDEVERAATTELRALETYIVRQVSQSVRQIQAMSDAATEAEVAAIDGQVGSVRRAAKQVRRPNVKGMRAAVEKAGKTLDNRAEQFNAGLNELSGTARDGLAEGGNKIVGQLGTITANVEGGLNTVRTPARKGLETLGKKAKEGSDKINTEWDKSLEGTQKTVDAKYDEAIAGMVSEIRKNLVEGKGKLTAQVNDDIKKNQEPLDQLETKMEEAAKEARDKYDAPWYKKVGRWLLSALWGFLKALGMFLLVVLAIVLAIVLIIVGIVFDIVILIVIGVIALIAIVVYVLYSAVKGWIARVMSAETWWQAAWAGIVGVLDIVGIPGVIEGIIQHDIVNGKELTVEEAGERFGAGLFGLLTLILPAKIKAGKVPVEPPRVPVEVPAPRPVIPEPRPVVPVPEARPTLPVPEAKPAPVVPEPKPAPALPEPKPAPAIPEPKPAPPVEPKPTVPTPEVKPTPPAEPSVPKPAEPSAPKPPEPKPAEPPPKPAEPKPGEPPPGEPKPAEPKPGEPPPAEPKPAEPKPGEPPPGEPKPAEPKPGEPPPAEPKPAEPKPAEPKPPEAKPGEEGKPGEKKAPEEKTPEQKAAEEKAAKEEPKEPTAEEIAKEEAKKRKEAEELVDKEKNQFKDPALEDLYQKYVKRKTKSGKTPRDRVEWKLARDYWLYDSPMARGNAFNKTAGKNYPYNEVHLENGKRLDSYNPAKGEIVSRKATDFDVIEPDTFSSYLKEFKEKYAPGTKIRSNKYGNIDGTPLQGKQILEVPKANEASANRGAFEAAAQKEGIEIRYTEE